MSILKIYFGQGRVLDDLYEQVKKSMDNPLSCVFVNTLNECKKHKSISSVKSDSLKSVIKERVIQSMYLAKIENGTLENRLNFLATVSSAAPFYWIVSVRMGYNA